MDDPLLSFAQRMQQIRPKSAQKWPFSAPPLVTPCKIIIQFSPWWNEDVSKKHLVTFSLNGTIHFLLSAVTYLPAFDAKKDLKPSSRFESKHPLNLQRFYCNSKSIDTVCWKDFKENWNKIPFNEKLAWWKKMHQGCISIWNPRLKAIKPSR